MALVNYPASSPYAATQQTSWYLGRYAHRTIPPNDGDRLITLDIRHEARPDLLAHELYGTAAYWWVFAVRNPSLLLDPVWGMRAGRTIYAPSMTHLSRVLGD